jgi:hypothetical protein
LCLVSNFIFLYWKKNYLEGLLSFSYREETNCENKISEMIPKKLLNNKLYLRYSGGSAFFFITDRLKTDKINDL